MYNVPIIEVIRDFDLVEEILEELVFWRYPTIGAILVIISGFIIGKPILRAKNKKTENELMNLSSPVKKHHHLMVKSRS